MSVRLSGQRQRRTKSGSIFVGLFWASIRCLKRHLALKAVPLMPFPPPGRLTAHSNRSRDPEDPEDPFEFVCTTVILKEDCRESELHSSRKGHQGINSEHVLHVLVPARFQVCACSMTSSREGSSHGRQHLVQARQARNPDSFRLAVRLSVCMYVRTFVCVYTFLHCMHDTHACREVDRHG